VAAADIQFAVLRRAMPFWQINVKVPTEVPVAGAFRFLASTKTESGTPT